MSQQFCNNTKIFHKETVLPVSRFVVGGPQDGGGMNSGQHRRRPFQGQELPALLCHTKVTAQQSLRRRSTQADNYFRVHEIDFGVQPCSASGYLDRVRLLVDAALASRLPLKVLDRIGHVRLAPIDTRLSHSLVEDGAGWPNKGSALQVFLVSWLFADE
jgi:hypothetical protein